MNEFQRSCIARVLDIFKELRIQDPLFQEVRGSSERYYLAHVSVDGRSCDIYVYEDEAGIMMAEKWIMCEKPDYRSPQELIEKFSQILHQMFFLGKK